MKESTGFALDALIAMRTVEGEHIQQDFSEPYRYTRKYYFSY